MRRTDAEALVNVLQQLSGGGGGGGGLSIAHEGPGRINDT